MALGKPVVVRFSDEDTEWLKKRADATNSNVSEVIRQLVKNCISGEAVSAPACEPQEVSVG